VRARLRGAPVATVCARAQAKLGRCFAAWLAPVRSDAMRSVFSGTLAELVQELGGAFAPLAPQFLPALLKETQSEAPQNRHHAVFALGCIMQQCPTAAREHVAEITSRVVAPLLDDASDSVRDNACGALARALSAHRNLLPAGELFKVRTCSHCVPPVAFLSHL
jgi:hypothetical protein